MGAGFHGGFGATKGYFESNPAVGEIVFASEDYAYISNIANRKDIDPDGLYDVVAHGTKFKIKFGDGKYDYYTPRQLARILSHREDYRKKGIRLLSCSTGMDPDGFAQHLANKLNVTVWAPNDLIWAYPSGRHIIAPRSKYNPKYPDPRIRGKFVPFYPGGNKNEMRKV